MTPHASTHRIIDPETVAADAGIGWLFGGLTLVACALILAPTLAYPMTADQGIFAYIGAQILKGHWPYVQTWESDFPGLMFLQAAEILVFGKSLVMFRLFDGLVQLGSAYLICRITYRVQPSRAAALIAAALFCLVYQGYGPWNTAQREGFGLFFVLLGFWIYLRSGGRRPLGTAAAIGLSMGTATLIKPTLLALTAFNAPLSIRLRHRHCWKPVLAALGGWIAPSALILTLYWSLGGIRQLYESCIRFQFVYTALLRGDGPLWLYWLSKLQRLGGHAVGLAVLYPPFLLWRETRRERFMLYLAYVGSVFQVFVQGTFAGYHYLPGLAIGSILIGDILARLAASVFGDRRLRIAGAQRRLRELALCGTLVPAVLFYVKPQTVRTFLSFSFLGRPGPHAYTNATVFDFTESFDVAEYMRTRTEPQDYIQVWGNESLVYYLANRTATSRFQMTMPLVERVPGHPLTPMQQRWRIEFANDMTMRRPKYVAVVRDDNWWQSPGAQTSEQLLDDFPEWRRFIETHYTLERTIGRFLIYRHV